MEETELPPTSSSPEKQADEKAFDPSHHEEEESQDPREWLLLEWKQSIILVGRPSISQGYSYPTSQTPPQPPTAVIWRITSGGRQPATPNPQPPTPNPQPWLPPIDDHDDPIAAKVGGIVTSARHLSIILTDCQEGEPGQLAQILMEISSEIARGCWNRWKRSVRCDEEHTNVM